MAMSSMKTKLMSSRLLLGNTAFDGRTASFDSIATLSGSGISTVTFSSIPQTYKSLQLRMWVRDTNAINPFIRFNGSAVAAYGGGTDMNVISPSTVTGSSASTTPGTVTSAGYSTNSPGYMIPSIADILDYSSTSKNKTIAFHSGKVDNIYIQSGLWADTSAITSIVISLATGTWGTGTSFELYGVN